MNDFTHWNPVRGCTPTAPGCERCWAKALAERFSGPDGFDVRLAPGDLAEPLRWREPKTILVCAASDLFEESVPSAYIEAVCRSMMAAPWHTFLVLTKRASRMRKLLSGPLREAAGAAHIGWGVSVEDRKHGVPRLTHLRKIRAPFRFVAFEPLLEDVGAVALGGLSWVIVGGETGPGARPLRAEWVRAIRRRCRTKGVPFQFRQWSGLTRTAAGRTLDGRTWDGNPPRSKVVILSGRVRRERIAAIEALADSFPTVALRKRA
jgi:protein gp37